jgi:hypothetical protein
MWSWITELTDHLSQTALEMRIIEIPVNGPVNSFENLPLLQFSGYQLKRDSPGVKVAP